MSFDDTFGFSVAHWHKEKTTKNEQLPEIICLCQVIVLAGVLFLFPNSSHCIHC